MNNEQFRRILLANSAKSGSDKNDTAPTSSRPGSGTPVALGSRLKSSIPMTPRSVAGGPRLDFAKQLAERNQAVEKSQKKFRSFVPKGSKFAQGYVDRSKTREEEEEDERAERLKALEESFKKEEIDRETFDRLRSEIAGGDLSSTHLVKGLDFKLLERIRRGDDVYNEEEKSPDVGKEQREESEEEDPDDILEKLESTEVTAIEKEKVQKKGQLATTTLNPGQKRSRNQILAEMKAARAAAAKAKAESSLGSKFKRIGEKRTPGTRIEKDSKGREVMIIVDEDGHERRKVRKLDPEALAEQEREDELLASSKVLGMEVPEFYRKQLEAQQAEEDGKEINIFDDAGSDYDPLAGLEGSDESSDEEGEAKDEPAEKASAEMLPPPKPDASAARNYFKGSKTALTSEDSYKTPSLDDPAFLAALKKAKAAGAIEKSEEERKVAEREERLKKKISESYRDEEDMDMGFGSSRVEDEADLDETKVKLSAWGGDDDDEGGEGGGGKSKRKRGGKKRKGDKNSFEDVMRDTFAILLAAYHPAIRILGVSTVFGNASLEKTTGNAASILTAIGKADTIPIYIGASHALSRPTMHPPTDIHGETGLDGTDLLPPATVTPLTTPPAIDAAYTALKSCPAGTAWVVATGAFTNAAALFLKYPDLIPHIRGLSLMGGALGGGFTSAVLGEVDGVARIGNWTPFAEFNVLADPEAAAVIFGNKALAGKTTLIPLDLSHLVLTTEGVRDLLLYGREEVEKGTLGGGGEKKTTRLRMMLVELVMFFAGTYSDVFGITEGPPLHDPLAVAAVLTGVGDQHEIPFCDSDPAGEPGLAQKERFEVTVVTEGTYEEARAGARTGQITARLLPPGEAGVRIPRNLDIPLFWKAIEECVSRADAANAAAEAAAAASGPLAN
ncbi:hypothetical protein C8A00DRAFT_44921 [Chaetomidium leptoderma]|uniref:Inosine/uridine-preferring nucleoside hydrolase domain-containing protein n=1 Tax=Chaetomidium leptoderma TaxID=669021 RepID=A0AAN6ZVM7_9PEZI|nr:hypothetical protein C8A00DRAFT_44921 [Chaetomidium leptoderma]